MFMFSAIIDSTVRTEVCHLFSVLYLLECVILFLFNIDCHLEYTFLMNSKYIHAAVIASNQV